jgi:hypothetical protein
MNIENSPQSFSNNEEDWFFINGRKDSVAERESLNCLYRYIVSDRNILLSVELLLYSECLQEALIGAKKLGAKLSLGDRNSLQAACRHCATRCLKAHDDASLNIMSSTSTTTSGNNSSKKFQAHSPASSDDTSDVKFAKNAELKASRHVEALMQYLNDYVDMISSSSVSTANERSWEVEQGSSSSPPPHNSSSSSPLLLPGTAPLSSCLFPRWQLATDLTELPVQLTGAIVSSNNDIEQLEKIEKIQDVYVNLLIAEINFTANRNAPVEDIMTVIAEVFQIF